MSSEVRWGTCSDWMMSFNVCWGTCDGGKSLFDIWDQRLSFVGKTVIITYFRSSTSYGILTADRMLAQLDRVL